MLNRLFGEVAQKCYEITQQGKYDVWLNYAHNRLSIIYKEGVRFNYIVALSVISEKTLKKTLEKLKGLENE